MNNHLPLNKQLCFALYETTNEFIRLYSQVLKSFGLTYPQYLVLLCLWEQDGISMKELGIKLNMGIGTLNPIVSRMMQNQWMIKKRSDKDERMVFIHLLEKAHTEKNNIMNRISSRIEECGLDIEEYDALMKYVSGLNSKLKKSNQ